MDNAPDPLASLPTLLNARKGVERAQAEKGLAALGFHLISREDLLVASKKEPSRPLLWCHPKGIVLGGWENQEGRLNNLRVSLVIDAGWRDPEQVLGQLKGMKIQTREGGHLFPLNLTLDPEFKHEMAFLQGGLEQMGGRLADFGQWREQAQAGRTSRWLFCLGNQAIEHIDTQVGMEQWLSNAPDDLVQMLLDRRDYVVGRSTPSAASPAWEERAGRAIRQVAQKAGISYPTSSQRKQIRAWMDMGTGEGPWKRDWSCLEGTGLMLPHILALMATETRAQGRLLMWCRQTPERALRKAFLDNPEGVGFIFRGAIEGHMEQLALGRLPQGRPGQPLPAAPMENAVQALQILSQRLGGEAKIGVGRAMAVIASLLEDPPKEAGVGATADFIQDFAGFLEAVHRLAQQYPGSHEAASQDRGAAYWEEAFALAGASDRWAPVVSRLKEWEMDMHLPQSPVRSAMGPKSRF